MTRVLLVGSERLTKEQTEALTKSFEKQGANVGLFPTNSSGVHLNWTELAKSLQGRTHLVLVIGKGENYITLREDVIKTWAKKIAVVYLEERSLELHSELLGEGHIDLAIVFSHLEHSKVPRRCTQSMIAEDLITSSNDIAKKFVGKVLVS